MALKTLDNSLEILKYFTKETPEWGVRELARELGISPSIVYRILLTFSKHGFLNKDENTNKYRLGLRFVEYGLIVQDRLKISEIVNPKMNKLKDETGESVFLTFLDDLEGICLSISRSSHDVKFEVTLGSRTPLYAGASAKVIMAYLPMEDKELIIERGLKSWTDKTITESQVLLEDLKQIKKQKWTYSSGEYTRNVTGIAVPIFDYKGDIMGSLTLGAPNFRISGNNIDF